MEAFKLLSKDMGLHLMSTEERYGVQPMSLDKSLKASTPRTELPSSFRRGEKVAKPTRPRTVPGNPPAPPPPHPILRRGGALPNPPPTVQNLGLFQQGCIIW